MSSFFEAVISFSVLFWIITIDQVFCDGELLSGVSECEKTGRCPTRHGPMTGRSVPIQVKNQINTLTNAEDSNHGMLFFYRGNQNKNRLTKLTSNNLLQKYLLFNKNEVNNFIETRLRRKSDDGNSSKKDNSGKGQRPTMLGPRPGRGFWPATRFNDDLNSLLNEIKSNPWIFISYHNKKHLTQSTSKFEYKQEPKDNLLLKYLMLRNDMNSLIDSQVNTQDRNR
ncbi:uncharacterized protein LOC141533112 [Cotesia typhae]|uniref:uncharacterized protein LOC141533112 n=1 Tax=Cotesia typhae TaxID=2053667 RepID=UPI003D68ADD0